MKKAMKEKMLLNELEMLEQNLKNTLSDFCTLFGSIEMMKYALMNDEDLR